MSRLNFFLVVTVAISAIGGLLFGYDIGVISGVLVMDRFINTFNWKSPLEEAFIVASLQLGCFIGSLLSSFFCDYLGRKRAILSGAFIFALGGVMQTVSFELILLYAGRLVSGIAIGLLSMAVPLYLSEMSPKDLRGRLVSMQQLAITVGICISFFINWATSAIPSDASWRIPFGIQVLIAIFMGAGMLFLPMSPRWLLSRNRSEDANRNLVKIRGTHDITGEFEEMQDAIRLEKEIGHGSWGELFSNGMWKRMAIGVGLQIFQQLTGINAIMYYAPTLLKRAGFVDTQVALLANAGTGIVNVVMTFPGILLVDRLGRKPLLIAGAVSMATVMSLLGALIGIYGPDFSNPAIPYVCLILMYMFVASFAFSWGPIGWIIPSEIYPLRIRAKAISITTASNWFFNFIIAQVVPTLLRQINWGVYLIFAGFHVIMALWVLFVLPETKNKSLEEIDQIFGQQGVTHAGEAKLKQTLAAGGH